MAYLSSCCRTGVLKYPHHGVNVLTKFAHYSSLLPPPRDFSIVTWAVPFLSRHYTIQSSVTMASPSVVKIVPEQSIMLICDMQTRFRTSLSMALCDVYLLHWLTQTSGPQVPR